LRSPAGRVMPCIKLLPLPPPRGRHWPVGGFQQCGVCVLSSCFPMVLWQLQRCECLCMLLQYFTIVRIFLLVCSGRLVHHMFGLLVSRPEGKVSCRREHVLGAGLGLNAEFHQLQSALSQGCMGRRFSSQLQAVAACLLVALLGGMGSFRLGLALVLCPSNCGGCSSLQRWHGRMRRRIPWLRQWSSIMDQTDVCCVHGSGRSFCRRCGAGLALPELGGRAPVCLGLCP